ncbi:MAG: hypothetical protein WBA22_09650 [Candidatus Methanofastidiosia archaeon]
MNKRSRIWIEDIEDLAAQDVFKSISDIESELQKMGGKFFFRGISTIDLTQTRLYHAHFQDTEFADCIWLDENLICEEPKKGR